MNLLETFPESICTMKSLKTLQLCGNKLHNLSPMITKLKHLITLSVSQNELVELPDDIGLLESLQHLDLRSNNLTFLPQSMSKLKKLYQTSKLLLEKNPLEHPPQDVVIKGTAAVLQYLQDNVMRRAPGHHDLERRKTHVSRHVTPSKLSDRKSNMQNMEYIFKVVLLSYCFRGLRILEKCNAILEKCTRSAY